MTVYYGLWTEGGVVRGAAAVDENGSGRKGRWMTLVEGGQRYAEQIRKGTRMGRRERTDQVMRAMLPENGVVSDGGLGGGLQVPRSQE
jgi:hypothetical protein